MGLGFTIDTPLKVARFGISSVISIVEDHLVEEMRELHCRKNGRAYTRINDTEDDYRAKRIEAYLNLVNELVNEQTERLRQEPFQPGSDIVKYFELLPDNSPIRKLYNEMVGQKEDVVREFIQKQLRSGIVAGSIDVNIMTKCDRSHYSKDGTALPPEYSDAMSALRGFARSNLSSSLIFSAGLNPRLYSYCGSFKDFFPDENGELRKKIVLKVSDYRSALVQGRFFAKKGLWVSEYRIESGLNCGGHAFATQGLLMGPILEEFRNRKIELTNELYATCVKYWRENNLNVSETMPAVRLSAQGGIGTALENSLLLEHYEIDSTGWGSPFLLVPEATNVDDPTLQRLAVAKPDDYYVSDSSPLGVPFNNFRNTTSEEQRHARIDKHRPGSPCYKEFLGFNTEFGSVPICTASRKYQHLKIQQIEDTIHNAAQKKEMIDAVMVKECLCEGLGASARAVNHIQSPHNLTAVSICPGPNLAYFSGSLSLRQMVDHIYGRVNILNQQPRQHMFINELKMYVDYLRNEIEKSLAKAGTRKQEYFEEFKSNLLAGITHYRNMFDELKKETRERVQNVKDDLANMEAIIGNIRIPVLV